MFELASQHGLRDLESQKDCPTGECCYFYRSYDIPEDILPQSIYHIRLHKGRRHILLSFSPPSDAGAYRPGTLQNVQYKSLVNHPTQNTKPLGWAELDGTAVRTLPIKLGVENAPPAFVKAQVS